MQGAVVALLRGSPRRPPRRCSRGSPRAPRPRTRGRPQAAPQPLQGVRVLPVAQIARRRPRCPARRGSPVELPGASRRGPAARPEGRNLSSRPSLLTTPPVLLHAARSTPRRPRGPRRPSRGSTPAAQVQQGRAPVRDGDALRRPARTGPARRWTRSYPGSCRAARSGPARQQRRVPVVRERQDRVLLEDPLRAARRLEHVRHVGVERGDVPPLGREPLVVGDGVALEEVDQGERLRPSPSGAAPRPRRRTRR